ncbi:MAG TPA: hypothetical protein VF337_04555 [Candidatus Limnocylindrales bacterium]
MSERHAVRARSAVTALAFVASLVLAGCSSAGATSAPPTLMPSVAASAADMPTDTAAATDMPTDTAAVLPDPCTLLTQDEADKLAGVKLGAFIPDGAPPTNSVWPAPLNGAVAQVEVGVGDGAKKFLDIDKDVLGHDFKQVSGLGDEAWQESDTVFVRTGDLWFSLHPVKLDSAPDGQANMVALAKVILGRIGN